MPTMTPVAVTMIVVIPREVVMGTGAVGIGDVGMACRRPRRVRGSRKALSLTSRVPGGRDVSGCAPVWRRPLWRRASCIVVFCHSCWPHEGIIKEKGERIKYNARPFSPFLLILLRHALREGHGWQPYLVGVASREVSQRHIEAKIGHQHSIITLKKI